MGLQGPHSRISWIRNELSATASIRPTQIQPTVRWGMVPFGAANCAMPSAKAAIAAVAWSTMAGEASSNGLRVMARKLACRDSPWDGNIRAGEGHFAALAAAPHLGLVPQPGAPHRGADGAGDTETRCPPCRSTI